MQRFAGTVKHLTTIDVDGMVRWITAIPFSDWHQQHPTQQNQLRPAMMSDPQWFDFMAQSDPVVAQIMQRLPGCTDYQRMVSVVMPGDAIPPHRDEQADYWLARVHVPLQADGRATFHVGGEDHNLTVGNAYLVNTLAVHGVTNAGVTPRIHFMFDIRG